jgi:hypothetical protein
MNDAERLKVGEIFKTAEGLWYVDSVNVSGAHCIGLSSFKAPITTRKRVTKIVNRHKRMRVFAATACVERVDPKTLDMLRVRKRIKMARKSEATPQTEGGENTGSAAAVAETPRATQRYFRTDKAAKEGQRGQGKTVLDALDKAGTNGATVGELVQVIGSFPGSRQTPERVVGFYLSKFKRDGLVRVVETPAPAAAAVEV